jgi:hypothetical protein
MTAFDRAFALLKHEEYHGDIAPKGTPCSICRKSDKMIFEHPITQEWYCLGCFKSHNPYPEVDEYDPTDPDWEDRNTYDWREDL